MIAFKFPNDISFFLNLNICVTKENKFRVIFRMLPFTTKNISVTKTNNNLTNCIYLYFMIKICKNVRIFNMSLIFSLWKHLCYGLILQRPLFVIKDHKNERLKKILQVYQMVVISWITRNTAKNLLN